MTYGSEERSAPSIRKLNVPLSLLQGLTYNHSYEEFLCLVLVEKYLTKISYPNGF